MFHVLKSLQLNKNSISLKNLSKQDPDVLAAFLSATHVFGYLPANDSRQQRVINKSKDLISSRERHVCFRCNRTPAHPVEPFKRGLGPCVPSQDEEALVGTGRLSSNSLCEEAVKEGFQNEGDQLSSLILPPGGKGD